MQGPLSLGTILVEFHEEDEALVRGILHDLCESGLVYRSGRGMATSYRPRAPEELGTGLSRSDDADLEALVWFVIYHQGPVDLPELSAVLGLTENDVQPVVEALQADGRVDVDAGSGQPDRFVARHAVLPIGAEAGWEAAVFDHYVAVVGGLCAKLRGGEGRARFDDEVGGSTWSFDLWPGHPLGEEIRGTLQRVRAEIADLRTRATPLEKQARHASTGRLVFYVGQNVFEDEPKQAEESA
jgi:hypothetical protein